MFCDFFFKGYTVSYIIQGYYFRIVTKIKFLLTAFISDKSDLWSISTWNVCSSFVLLGKGIKYSECPADWLNSWNSTTLFLFCYQWKERIKISLWWAKGRKSVEKIRSSSLMQWPLKDVPVHLLVLLSHRTAHNVQSLNGTRSLNVRHNKRKIHVVFKYVYGPRKSKGTWALLLSWPILRIPPK